MDSNVECRLNELREPGRPRWLAPWATYVLALLVGTVAAGGSALAVGAAVFGMPLAWVAGWANARSERWGWSAVVALFLLGLAIGFALSYRTPG
jgi:hypothetical protein